MKIITHQDGSIQLDNLQAYAVWMPTTEKINGLQLKYKATIGEAILYITHDEEDKELPYGILSIFKNGYKKWVSEAELAEAIHAAELWAFELTGGITDSDWHNASNEDREEFSKQSNAGAQRYNNMQE